MSQPFDIQAKTPALRPIDAHKGEFWVPNPWLFSASGENLSAYERNGVHLNAGGGAFHNISYLSGADSEGDGRTVVSFDLNGDGMLELLVRQAGGGSLIVYENRFPKGHWLRVSLRGTKSNRFGVGAKLAAVAGGRTVRRELQPVINFLAQAPAQVHFGLGEATTVDSLTIRWPSGAVQEVRDVPADRHVVITEGDDTPKLVEPDDQGPEP